MLNKYTETFLECTSDAQEAKIVLFGAPFDGTTSYRPGTRFGSGASAGNPTELKVTVPIRTGICWMAGFWTAEIWNCPLEMRKRLWRLSRLWRRRSSPPESFLYAGGEHLVTLGAFRAAVKKYPGIHIIHFDAHADLRQEYLDVELSHACVLRRCWELAGDGRIHQFGIRSGDREEFLWGKDHVETRKFDFEGLEETLDRLKGQPVYFTLDLDVLDPSVFPGTGTPERAEFLLRNCGKRGAGLRKADVAACDVNELSPPYDPSGSPRRLPVKL